MSFTKGELAAVLQMAKADMLVDDDPQTEVNLPASTTARMPDGRCVVLTLMEGDQADYDRSKEVI